MPPVAEPPPLAGAQRERLERIVVEALEAAGGDVRRRGLCRRAALLERRTARDVGIERRRNAAAFVERVGAVLACPAVHPVAREGRLSRSQGAVVCRFIEAVAQLPAPTGRAAIEIVTAVLADLVPAAAADVIPLTVSAARAAGVRPDVALLDLLLMLARRWSAGAMPAAVFDACLPLVAGAGGGRRALRRALIEAGPPSRAAALHAQAATRWPLGAALALLRRWRPVEPRRSPGHSP